jgi:hypothetical protein
MQIPNVLKLGTLQYRDGDILVVMKGQGLHGTEAMNGLHAPTTVSNEACYVVDWNKLPERQTYSS